MNTKLSISEIRDDLKWLGNVEEVYNIGDYQIAKYISKDDKKERYHPYYKGKSYSTSYNSVEEAMVGVVAYRFDGLNTKADVYFIRAINFETNLVAKIIKELKP